MKRKARTPSMAFFSAPTLAMYSGRPGTLSVDDFGDRLLANYAKARAKDTKLTKVRFLEQLPGFLELEALRLWRKNKDTVLTAPADPGELSTWDPLDEVVKLFKKEFGGASAEQVRELMNLKKKTNETCKMLRSRLEYLAEETGLLNNQEQAMKFVEALPQKLHEQVTPILYSKGQNGVYTLDQAFEVADRLDLATAYASGRKGQLSKDEDEYATKAVTTNAKATALGKISCFRCGREGHGISECQMKPDVICSVCQKKGHMAAACWTKHGKPPFVGQPSSQNNWGNKEETISDIVVQFKELKIEFQKLVEQVAQVVKGRSATIHDMDEY